MGEMAEVPGAKVLFCALALTAPSNPTIATAGSANFIGKLVVLFISRQD